MKEKGNEGYNNKGKSVLELLNFAARAEVARRSRRGTKDTTTRERVC